MATFEIERYSTASALRAVFDMAVLCARLDVHPKIETPGDGHIRLVFASVAQRDRFQGEWDRL